MAGVFLIFLIITIFALLIVVEIRDAFRPKQVDWVEQRHRAITHRGFKSRAGMR